ncbi:MAG: hypothetical protein ACYDBY_14635 [Thermoanaerobaculia bacterium]
MKRRPVREEQPAGLLPLLRGAFARARRALEGKTPAAAAALVVATVVGSLTAYSLAGRGAVEVLSTSLPDAPASTGQGLLQRTYPGPQATSFDVTFVPSDAAGEGIWRLPKDARLEVQVETQGRRIRLGLSDPADAGETGRTLRVSDRAWVSLGPAADGLAPRTVRIRSLDEARFSLLRPIRPERPDLREIAARVADATPHVGAQGPPRYRIVVDRPVPPREALARLLALPGISRLLAAALALGLAGAIAGAVLVFRRPATAVAFAIVGVALVHAAMRPPLHGEDESSHVGTVEYAVFEPGRLKGTRWWLNFPESIVRLGSAFDLDRVQFNPLQSLPLAGSKARTSAADAIRKPHVDLVRELGVRLPGAGAVNVDARAPLYYKSFAPLRPFFSRLGLLSRVSAYRLVSTLLALAAFGGGLLLLARAFPTAGPALLFGLAALVPPYLMSLLTTVSNYSLAIGFGLLIAAAFVSAVAGERRGARLAAGAVLLAATLVGTGVYRDFAGLFPAAFAFVAFGGPAMAAAWAWRRGGAVRQAGLIGSAVALAALGWGLWATLLSKPERMKALVAFVLARKPASLPPVGDPVWPFVIQVVLAPLALGLVLALFAFLGRKLDEHAATRLAWARSAAGLALFAALFFSTPFRQIPVETTRLEFRDEVAAFWNAFFSTAFSFDQDVLSWKMYWGVFGWADTRYPDLVYAVAKWLCVALFLALPVLSRKTLRERRFESALLLVFAGLATTLAFASNTARYFIPVNPWGRFILPWVPIALFAALARIDLDARRETVLRWLFVGAVCFHLWTAIYVVGVRYFIPR